MARRPITEKRIQRLLKEGRGSGHGADYKPFIRVGDFASRGRVHREKSQTHGRVVHLFSDMELDVFRKFDGRPDVVDIREQYPLCRAETMVIADQLGVAHPAKHGVDVPVTTDLLVDFLGGRRVAIAVKPAEELAKRRVLEKLEIERVFHTRRGVDWKLAIGSDVSRAERFNMQERAPWAFVDGLVAPNDVDWDECADVMLIELADSGASRVVDLCEAAERRHGWTAGTGLSALKRLRARNLVGLSGAGAPRHVRSAEPARAGRRTGLIPCSSFTTSSIRRAPSGA